MTGIETTTITVGELTFDALAAGPSEGELVVLLHGFPQVAELWRPVASALAGSGYCVVAPSQRGYSPGARPVDDAAYTMDHLVGDVVGMVDALGVERFHLVGHDWGGAVAWNTAGFHGERLRSLTSIATPHPAALAAAFSGELGGDQAERSGYMALFSAPGAAEQLTADDAAGLRLVFAASGLDDAAAAVHVAALGTAPALDAALAWYRSASGSLIGSLAPITVPTLYIWGTEDPALGREAAEATADHVEGPYRFAPLGGVGHWVVEAAADDVVALLLEHLATAAAG